MNRQKNLVSVEQLAALQADLEIVILDGSWYLPAQQRDPRQEFLERHIPGARFFDIDAISDQSSDLPHMIPEPGFFAESVRKLGVSKSSKIVVYDGAGLFSAARVWWLFRLFGHTDVAVLDGGLPAWIKHEFEVTDNSPEVSPGNFTANTEPSLVTSVEDMRDNCHNRRYTVLDARPATRYRGEAPEPRPELPSGHMPGSTSLPFTELLDDGSLKPCAELKKILDHAAINPDKPVITSCGSGVTAAVITLALDTCGLGMHKLYDGSWTEWASDCSNPIVTGENPG